MVEILKDFLRFSMNVTGFNKMNASWRTDEPPGREAAGSAPQDPNAIDYHDSGDNKSQTSSLTECLASSQFSEGPQRHEGREARPQPANKRPSATMDVSSVNSKKRQRTVEPSSDVDAQIRLEFEIQQHHQTSAKLETTTDALEAEALLHAGTQDELERTKLLLERTQLQLRTTESELQEKEQQMEDVRKRWRDSANQLDRFMRQAGDPNQMTDDEIINKTNALRFAIKNFAFQFFGDNIIECKVDQTSFNFLNTHLGLSRRTIEAYMESQRFRPSLIRAFLWQTLREQLFGKFRWVEQEASSSAGVMKRFLKPSRSDDAPPTTEQLSKYHKWRANTSSLVSEAMSVLENSPGERRQFVAKHSAMNMCWILAQYSTSDRQVIEARLSDIVRRAMELDEQLSQQVANFAWVTFKAPHTSHTFSSRIMELERGEEVPHPQQTLQLVLSSSLVKWGKSSGEDFDMRTVLLKSEVTFESPPRNSPRRSFSAAGRLQRRHHTRSSQFLRDQFGRR